MEIEREDMDVDVLFVGAGPGNLISAWHLMNLLNEHNQAIEKGTKEGEPFPIDEMMIVLIEKGESVGTHNFSGAVLDPIAIKEFMPDFIEQGFPVEGKVEEDAVMFMTESGAYKLPITPPFFENHGNYVISLSKVCRWLGEKAEENLVQIFAGFPGVKVLLDDDKRVIGVQTGDKGVDPDGNQKDNFEPGINLKSKVTVFGEGPRGHLMRQLEQELDIQKDRNPQGYEMGVKEVIELPEGRIKAGQVWHTMSYPLKLHTFGGSFIYGMADNKVAIGMVVDLHSPDPYLDAHRELQKLKAHPWVAKIIEGGKVVEYGGKALPVGGYHSMPKLAFDGGLVLGDSASMLDSQRLKGIHLAMKAGMLAAETIFEAMVKKDFSARQLESYETRVKNSYIHEQLYKVRNFHAVFDDGMLMGGFKAGLQYLFGLFNSDKKHHHENHHRTRKVMDLHTDTASAKTLARGIKYDGKNFLDKLTDAYLSGTKHEEKQPSHLRLTDPEQCVTCWELYRAPCTNFCPVQVYEMPEDVQEQVDKRLLEMGSPFDAPTHADLAKKSIPMPGENPRIAEDQADAPMVPGQQWPGQLLHINFTNCVHCKTCDIKCPFLNLSWTPPEGGGGPGYTMT